MFLTPHTSNFSKSKPFLQSQWIQLRQSWLYMYARLTITYYNVHNDIWVLVSDSHKPYVAQGIFPIRWAPISYSFELGFCFWFLYLPSIGSLKIRKGHVKMHFSPIWSGIWLLERIKVIRMFVPIADLCWFAKSLRQSLWIKAQTHRKLFVMEFTRCKGFRHF